MKMKSQIIRLVALIALFTGGFSCADDRSCDCPEGSSKVINSEKKSASFAIDNNIISFAAPNVACVVIAEHPSRPNGSTPESLSPHFWTIDLLMQKGTNATKLAPIITLAPDASITYISTNRQGPKPVDYTGIAEIGAMDFSKQVEFGVTAPDGSTVTYSFLAVDIGFFQR